ncbi:hypothetical protein ACFLYO_05050 [Chloroflexota bacterium]
MMISRDTLRNGFFIGIATAFIVIIGMPVAFAERYVISGVLTLGVVILFGILLGAGYFAGRQSENNDKTNNALLALNGAVISAMAVTVVALITLLALQLNMWADGIDMSTIFPNVDEELIGILTFGQQSILGWIMLLIAGAIMGVIGALSTRLPARVISISMISALMIIIMGLLQDQINNIISLIDAIWVTVAVAIGYLLATWRNRANLGQRILEAGAIGALIGAALAVFLLLLGAGSEAGASLIEDKAPILESLFLGKNAVGSVVLLALFWGSLGIFGAALSAAAKTGHQIGILAIIAFLILGILNQFGEMTLLAAGLTLLVLVVGQLISGRTTQQADVVFAGFNRQEQNSSQRVMLMAGLMFALILPHLLTGYITNVVDLILLYTMMGLGLNIVVGFAGLLDLGYVAFFAIGAYTVGVLTTPSVITCGGISPADIPTDQIEAVCTGMTTFWVAWPAAIFTAGMAGVMLGIPVLRLRGDYLAIVTLGFGEIIRLLAQSDLFKPYLGGAQGIVNIPSPIINLTGLSEILLNTGLPFLVTLGEYLSEPISLSGPTEIYYLILFGVIVAAFVSYRLLRSRLGRSWQAMREDEDVAQAMGIHLVNTKLLAFSIGAAFSGIGGAIFGSYLKSIFPNSFTLLISINILSVVIIGGMGSIPGVFLGALVIFGLPEALREFQEYRLLMFGTLLVVTMLLRPQGLLPPKPPRMEEEAQAALAKEGA